LILANARRRVSALPPDNEEGTDVEAVQDQDDWVSIVDASAILGVPQGTLRQWRSYGKGPVSYKPGRAIQYKRKELLEWKTEREEATRRGGKVKEEAAS
jgi:hypothetical protein